MAATPAQQTGGLNFLGALFLLFLGLKLGGVIAWSWWWITAPLWAPAIAVVGIVLLIAINVVIVRWWLR